MLKIFGKNNNQLFRNSQKTAYSMPQSLPFSESVLTCACGYDYLSIITTQFRLYFLFQAKLYLIQNVPLLIDIATSQNTICMISKDSQILVWDFDEEKLHKNSINYTRLKLDLQYDDKIKQVQMGGNDIFLLSEIGKVYHFKRNNWYETKTYSNIQSVQLSHKIVKISAGPKNNLFLSYQGVIFTSSKEEPLMLYAIQTNHTFIHLAADLYCAGITKKGTIMIWGNSIHGSFNQPTEFTKLAKKFISVKLNKENGYAVADDGEVWVWGVNANGELGLSDYQTRIKPFPLITLQKNYVIELFCGNSYACCLCNSSQKFENNKIRILDKRVSEFSISRPYESLTHNRKNSKFIHLQDLQMESKSITNFKCSPFSKNKMSHKHSCPSKPITVDQKLGLKYINDECKKTHQDERNWTITDNVNQLQTQKYSSNNNLQMEVMELKEQNQRLKQRVSEQSDVIADITVKIRLLEEAIDEYEKNLTSRDHILQDYQAKEKQYICHIGELQRTIDEIVKSKEKNSQILVVYEDMKSNFQRERQAYTQKIKSYESKLFSQDERRKEDINRGKVEQVNKENSLPKWQSYSPINKKPGSSPQFVTQGRSINNQSMDSVINQIESNKKLITKSANKLIAMLDISQ